MFARILIGYDGSKGAWAALATALRLAGESGATVTAVTVQHHLPRYAATIGEVDEEREVEAADARRLANEIRPAAPRTGCTGSPTARPATGPDRHHPALAHGRATVAVYTHILVGYDGSRGSRAALQAALRLARDAGAGLTALTVQHHLPRYGATVGEVDEERDVEAADARRLANEIQAQADEYGVTTTTTVVPGHPAQEIVRAAKQTGADLIVLGHSGHSAVWGAFLGTVTEKVSRHAPCSVLIVR